MGQKKTAHRKRYRMRMVGTGGVESTIPKVVVERAAKENKQTVEDFVMTHDIIHLFGNFDSFTAAYRFVPRGEVEDIEVPSIS